jgi:dihydroneopterin aldolase
VKIKIKNLTGHCIIGVYEEEKHKKQKVIVNIEIDYDEGVAGESDSIEDTLNYHPICDWINNIIAKKEFELIEALVEEIGSYIISLDRVSEVYVEIDKPDAPIAGIESISVSKKFNK